jgi:hypothetical protein
MKARKPPSRHYTHAGYSIPAAAHELKIPEGVLRRAVRLGEVETVPFGGLDRVPPREIDRLREIFRTGQMA